MSVEAELYLRQEVFSSSPARLRWMLIQRAVNLASSIAAAFEPAAVSGFPAAGASESQRSTEEQLLGLREILNELLAGVTSRENDLGRSVADLYVYLIALLTEAEAQRDAWGMQQLAEILKIEEETWQLYCRQEGAGGQLAGSRPTAAMGQPTSLSLEA
jgi:flagellar secretion chaperone FliS